MFPTCFPQLPTAAPLRNIVVMSSFVESMSVKSPFPLLSPKSCQWVDGWVCERVFVYTCEWVSVCVCCTHLVSFFPVSFALVNDLLFSGFSFLFWKCVRFCFLFLFLFVVCTCILCLLPCLTRCSFMYPHWGFWNKLLDLTWLDKHVPSTARAAVTQRWR